jgi:hypothetical protein
VTRPTIHAVPSPQTPIASVRSSMSVHVSSQSHNCCSYRTPLQWGRQVTFCERRSTIGTRFKPTAHHANMWGTMLRQGDHCEAEILPLALAPHHLVPAPWSSTPLATISCGVRVHPIQHKSCACGGRQQQSTAVDVSRYDMRFLKTLAGLA